MSTLLSIEAFLAQLFEEYGELHDDVKKKHGPKGGLGKFPFISFLQNHWLNLNNIFQRYM